MSDTKTNQSLAQAFARLSKAAARRKIYSRKAAKEGRPEAARFLRAMSASEAVQAHRLFNSLIGRVDTSEAYLSSIFEEEVQTILENYSELINNAAAERPALVHALSQLRAAETRLRSFYSQDSKDVHVDKDADYFVCRFCGYLAIDSPPEKCPVCGAPMDAFHEVN
ncbi:MAG: rubredoxin-like domain-containing protein [Thermodesulfobacteriota bacterium]